MFINLTPHTVNVNDREFPSSGQAEVARVSQTSKPAGVHDGIELVRANFGEVVDLPEQQTGVIFIVSAMVRSALPERKDLASPGEQIRDADGKIIGIKNLIIN